MKRVVLDVDDLEAYEAACLAEEPFLLDANCGADLLTLALLLALPRKLVWGLEWTYYGAEKRPRVHLPPGLVRLKVRFLQCSSLDFAASALRQCPGLQELVQSGHGEGDAEDFFAALEQSTVSHLGMWLNGATRDGLFAYLRRDRLTDLHVSTTTEHDSAQLFEVLRDCSMMKSLSLRGCKLNPEALMNLPPRLTKLHFLFVRFVHDFDWSFLVHSAVNDLSFGIVYELDSNILCAALSARLARRPMERLAIRDTYHNAHPLHNIPFDRIKALNLQGATDYTLDAIAAALVIPGSHLRELTLWSNAARTHAHLVPALRDPRCSLTKLELRVEGEGIANRFHQRLRLLALLQGQIRLRNCPLRRLPVEMFRLVGEM